nr:transglycosylase domain-containing protein [Metabacillus kandeliae]
MRAFFGWTIVLLLTPLFVFVLIGSGSQVHSMKSIPAFLDEKIPLHSLPLLQNSYIFDRDGGKISVIAVNNQRRVYTDLGDIPEAAKQLFVVSEDRNFYTHKGFDMNGIARAVLVNVKNGSLDQGASTITQQLARNLYLTHERTYNRKMSELLYSWQIERKLNKDKILESYLNTIYFQNNIYGIGTAAEYYFSKPLKALSLAQTAYIASIPNNPALYNPLKRPDAVKKRQERLLKQLLDAGDIKGPAYEKAVSEKIKLDVQKVPDLYPDYTTYVHAELKQLIADNEGLKTVLPSDIKKLEKRTEEVLGSGIKIETALDPAMQEKAVHETADLVPEKDVQASAVVINHLTHSIIAITGGKGYEKMGFQRGFQSRRQPGSAIKPLLDYVPYMEKTGAGPSSLISGAAFCKNGYCPENYSKKFYGMVTLKQAFQQSYNTPAVRMLDSTGIERGFQYLEPFHFAKLAKESRQLRAAIGGMDYGLSPLELTGAYTAFASDGVYSQNHAITRVTDLKGHVLYRWKDHSERVWKPDTNQKMRELLQAVIKNGTGKKAGHSTPGFEGGKTGTTNDYNDLWFIGLNNTYTAGVWIGKDGNGSVESVYKRGAHLQIWKDLMQPLN